MAKDQNNKHQIKVKRGIKRECILSPILFFNTHADEMMRNTKLKYRVTELLHTVVR